MGEDDEHRRSVRIIAVSLDTLRADHLSCYGYDLPLSPRIDRFASDGARFTNAFAGDIPTQPSHTAMFTGRLGIHNGIVSHFWPPATLDPAIPWLPDLFKQCGHATGAVDSMLTMKDWFGWGYEHYVTPELRSRTPADVVNDLAFPWLEQHASDDFFLFLHYWDPHVPYVPPEPYRTRLTAGVPRQDPAEVGRTLRASPSYPLFKRLNYDRIGEIPSVDYISALYDAEIAFLDDQLGRLFDHLVALGIYDDTLIVLFGDHGENLFEHDAWWDHAGLYECVVHVPLMVRHPATVRPGTVVDATVQLVDVFPTVCEAARIDVPEATDGISVWPLIRGQRTRQYDVVCLSECTWQAKRAIRTGRWKYIRCYDAGVYSRWGPELYDLEADPTERQNLAHDLTGVAADLDDSLSEWLEAQLGGAPDPMEAVLDGELPGARRLRDAIREEARRPLRERMAPAGL